LKLFRIYKDPAILLPQFEPLFERIKFLDCLGDSFNPDIASECSRDLIDFVAQLEMGSYYAKKISQLVAQPMASGIYIMGDEESIARNEESIRQGRREYQTQLTNCREAVYHLVVELLRFQNWKIHKSNES